MKTLLKLICGFLALSLLAFKTFAVQSLEERLNQAHQLLTSDPKASSQYLNELESEQQNFNASQNERFLLYRSHNLLMEGKHEESIVYLNRLLESSQDINIKAQAYSMLAIVYTNNSEYMNAFVNIEKARLLLNDLTETKAIKTVLANSATIYIEVGFVDKAYEFSNSYLKELSKNGIPKELCFANFNSGHIEMQLQSYTKAKEYFLEAAENCKQSNQELFYIVASQELASILVMNEKDEQPIKQLMELQKAIENINWDVAEAGGLIKIASAYLELDRNKEAIDFASKAFDTKSTNQYLPHKKESTRILASAYSNLGNNKKAIEYYQLYIDTERQIQLQLKQRKMAYYIAMQSME